MNYRELTQRILKLPQYYDPLGNLQESVANQCIRNGIGVTMGSIEGIVEEESLEPLDKKRAKRENTEKARLTRDQLKQLGFDDQERRIIEKILDWDSSQLSLSNAKGKVLFDDIITKVSRMKSKTKRR